MAEILTNPIEEIYGRFCTELVNTGYVTATQISFGKSDVGAEIPWVSFKPMTNYTWTQLLDLSNNENGIIVNVQVECFAKKETTAMNMEDATKQILFNMGFYSTGFNQRFKNNSVHRYIARYALRYVGEVYDLADN